MKTPPSPSSSSENVSVDTNRVPINWGSITSEVRSENPDGEKNCLASHTLIFNREIEASDIGANSRTTRTHEKVNEKDAEIKSLLQERAKCGGRNLYSAGGGQERTPEVAVKIKVCIIFFLAMLGLDFTTLHSLVQNMAPDNGWATTISMAGGLLGVIGAIEFFVLLGYRQASDRVRFEKIWARLNLVAALLLLASIAWRFGSWSQDPVEDILSGNNSGHSQLLSSLGFGLGLLGQIVIGASALLTAERLAVETRQPSIKDNPQFAFLTAQIDQCSAELAALNANLDAQRAISATLEDSRAAYLTRVKAAYRAEYLAYQAEKAMRNSTPTHRATSAS